MAHPVCVLLSLRVSDLAHPKIHNFGHIMCDFRLHGTAVEITVGGQKAIVKSFDSNSTTCPYNGVSCATLSGKLCQHVMPEKFRANTLKVRYKCP